MAGSTDPCTHSPSTHKKRSRPSSIQVRGLVRVRSKVVKDEKQKLVVFTMLDNHFINTSSKDAAKDRKMSVSMERYKANVDGSAANGSTNVGPSVMPKTIEGAVIPTFTAIEDVALKALKADGKSWGEIDKLFTDKSLDHIKARYKELKAAAKSSDAASDATHEGAEAKNTKEAGIGKEEDKQGSKKGKGMSKVNVNGEGAVQVTAKNETPAKKTSSKGTSSSAMPTIRVQVETGEKVISGDIVNIRDGEVLTVAEVAHLLTFIPRYEKKMWLAVASRYLDKTSKRIDYLELMKVVKSAYMERCQGICCRQEEA